MRNFGVALLSLVVVVLVTETVLRATHAFNARVAWTEPDPEIGYRFTPGRAYWFFAENDHPVEGRINALGWRDYERARDKPAGCYRVAVLGDSYVEAFQVELDSTFAAIAERRLNATLEPGGRTVEFMNFGRSGMTTTEERIVLERDVFRCDPDAVVVLFTFDNDIADVNPATATAELRPYASLGADGSIRVDTGFARSAAYRTRVRLNPLKQRSALVSLVAERYNVWRRAPARGGHAGSAGATITRALSLCTARPDSTFLENYRVNKALLADMARGCAARGVKLWIMAVPPVRDDASTAALRARDPSFDPGFFDCDLAALAEAAGAGFVPLTGRFAAAARAGGEGLFWGHWNYAGHRVAAGALADALGPEATAE
ncbi:MAG TPA: SGNH/GDSL hydrolase family protein [Candidatus Krumholzibacteria bacterium]|nr:SGNH/GDSL hydrolase family protein [Candidatus Krumholzibacteria bacterium]